MNKPLLAIFIGISVTAAGCRHRSRSAASAPPPTPPAAQGPMVIKPLNTPTYWAFARKIQAAVKSRNPAAINACIDFRQTVINAMKGLKLSPRQKRDVLRGAMGQQTLGKTLSNVVSAGGSYTLLGVRSFNGQPRAVFRIKTATGILNYDEWVMTRLPNGAVVCPDIYAAATGEMVSQTMHRSMVLLFAASKRTFWQRLTGADSQFAKHSAGLSAMDHDLAAGHLAAAIRQYHQLPRALRHDKIAIIIWYSACARVYQSTGRRKQQMLKASAVLNHFYPNDPAENLLDIETFLIQHKYQRAAQYALRVSNDVGGDPYQLAMAASIELKAGTAHASAIAQRYADMGQRMAPPDLHAYWADVTISLKNKDYWRVTTVLLAIEKTFHIPLKNLRKAPLYHGYVQSPAYQTFLKQNAAAANAPFHAR